MSHRLPLARPRPDIQRFISILAGKDRSSATPLVEYIVDDAVMKLIVTDVLGRRWVDWGESRETQRAYLDNFIELWHRLGYDFVRFERGLPFPIKQILAPDTAAGSAKQRAWSEEHTGSIQSWEDFDRYPWPKIEEMDFFPFEYINTHLPTGMGLLTCHAGGIFEHLSWIMSLEGLCLALVENPGLVTAVARRIGELLLKFYEHLIGLDRVAAVFAGDDLGFRTGTLISPDDLRKYCLPWHERIAALVHRKGLPYFLHSCGNIEAVMPDFISVVQIDGKHSFEDAVLPVEEYQKKYGDRIAVLGGLDVHILASSTPKEIREKTRALIETCGRRGRYAIGSGNSIPSYVPAANYLAMVDEALFLR
ncbi:MAG: uroporphyrinogen decarboxylase family protein [Candidatus Aminicenantales bacterium]